MRRLQRLDLSNNQISRLGPFGICCAVRVLRLAGNRIGTLTGIDDIARTLTELDVSRNQLRTVHDIQPLSGCSRLTTVRLDGNPLLHDVPRTVKSRAYRGIVVRSRRSAFVLCAALSCMRAQSAGTSACWSDAFRRASDSDCSHSHSCPTSSRAIAEGAL